MYKKPSKQLEFEDFIMPFDGKLKKNNRWVQLAKLMPWDFIEENYAKNFAESGMGSPAKSSRIALGALIVKEKLNLTDEETVEQIEENPYLQFFLGYESYLKERPFDPSMMVHFRKRIGFEVLNKINEKLPANSFLKLTKKQPAGDKKETTPEKPNQGKLIIDATCTPADIRYPTDLSLLNEAREKTETIIDKLFKPKKGKEKKVRTYRKKARKDYLKTAKKKKFSLKDLFKAVGKQLCYVSRNLKNIDKMLDKDKTGVKLLTKRDYKNFLVIKELFRQQEYMHDNKINQIENRIVSISQPHVRPIVRGKAGAAVEFGAKISVSLVNGYVFLDRLDWEAYNESADLIGQVETYKKRFGCFPESVHADKIYRNRKNLEFCKEKGIRISGPALGRPKSLEGKEGARLKRQARQDEKARVAIEGKFGQGKRRFSLDCIMSKLSETSESEIATIMLVMNLERCLRSALFLFKMSIFTIFHQLLADFKNIHG
jgi:transposase, IS5 family